MTSAQPQGSLTDSPALQPEAIEARIQELRPWRYSHAANGVEIESEFPAADDGVNGRGRYKDIVTGITKAIIGSRDPATMRVLDLGCCEGHYTAIFCALGFKEVVGIDLSRDHLARADFLLKTVHGFDNVTLLYGNVNDSALVEQLGHFDIILCFGLLYHLKDPLLLFDVFERLQNKQSPAHILMSTQFKGSYLTMVSPEPILEMQVKGLPEREEGVVFNEYDGSAFERISLRMNPRAIAVALQAYGYSSTIAYDTPLGGTLGFTLDLVISKTVSEVDERLLSNDHGIGGLAFKVWNGIDLDGYVVSTNLLARCLRRIGGACNRLVNRVTVDRRLGRRVMKPRSN